MRGFNYKKKYNLILLVGVLALMGVGYAYLSTTVNFNGSALINSASWDIHLENLQVVDGSVTPTTAATIDSNRTSVSYGVTLINPGDFYEFTVDAKNDGSIDGMIDKVTSKLNNVELTTLPDYLTYKVSYSSNKKIEVNHFLKSASKETFKVKIMFKKDINVSQLPTENQNLNLNFSLSYIQADENGVEVRHTLADSLMGFDESSTVLVDDGTADHNMRFIGKNPNNYVMVNDEEWRVVGVFNNIDDGTGKKEKRAKIVKSTLNGKSAWNSSNVNVWKDSSLSISLQELSIASGEMIDNAVWYLGDSGVGARSTAYINERGVNVADGNDSTWTGKVALNYPSDYGYASSTCSDSVTLNLYQSRCNDANWLSLKSYSYEWFLSPCFGSSTCVRAVNNGGPVSYINASFSGAVRPAAYLKSGVLCKNCDDSTAGTKSNPFQIEMKQ